MRLSPSVGSKMQKLKYTLGAPERIVLGGGGDWPGTKYAGDEIVAASSRERHEQQLRGGGQKMTVNSACNSLARCLHTCLAAI